MWLGAPSGSILAGSLTDALSSPLILYRLNGVAGWQSPPPSLRASEPPSLRASEPPSLRASEPPSLRALLVRLLVLCLVASMVLLINQ